MAHIYISLYKSLFLRLCFQTFKLKLFLTPNISSTVYLFNHETPFYFHQNLPLISRCTIHVSIIFEYIVLSCHIWSQEGRSTKKPFNFLFNHSEILFYDSKLHINIPLPFSSQKNSNSVLLPFLHCNNLIHFKWHSMYPKQQSTLIKIQFPFYIRGICLDTIISPSL